MNRVVMLFTLCVGCALAACGSDDSATAAAAVRVEPATASPTAGEALVVTLTVLAPDGKPARGFRGTLHLTSTDVHAVLPGDVAFSASDAGAKPVAVTLQTAGTSTLVATDATGRAGASGSATLTVRPAAPTLVLGMPANANAGYPVTVDVAVKDAFGNAIPAFAGTVAFASSDSGAGAVTPAPLAFTGSEGGVGSTLVTFITPGPQTLSATGGSAAGSATASVHGLVYTGPGAGRVRLIANAAQSSAQVLQLDLVAAERLEVSEIFGGGPGPFGVGMNLPLDTTRVTAGAPLFTAGAALPLGDGAPVALGRIGPDHVLYTVVSSKRVVDPELFFQSTDVQAGQVFYSVRLQLTSAGTPGTVFDGAAPSPLYRAAVRDQLGDDVVSQADIGVGKLEIR